MIYGENNIRLGEYPYTYARVSAMRAKLLKPNTYTKIMKMRTSELAKYLWVHEYKSQVSDLSASLEGTKLIEESLKENITSTFNKLKKITSGDLRKVIFEYLKKEDALNLKTIIRGKLAKADNEEIRKLLIPVGELTVEKCNKLLQQDSIEKILGLVKLTKYPQIIEALKVYKSDGESELIELAIDRLYYENLIAFIDSLGENAVVFRNHIAGEIDILNIRIILKFIKQNVRKDMINKLLFFTKSSKISKAKWEKIASLPTLDGIEKEFRKTPYEKIIKECFSDQKGSSAHIDLALQKHLLKRAKTITHTNPMSADIIFSYIFEKEIEIRNLYLIAKAKQLNLGEEFIQKELVV